MYFNRLKSILTPRVGASNQWRCGRKYTGGECLKGPDASGKCTVTFECAPQIINGEWMCRRPASAGGKCAEGPVHAGRCSRKSSKCKPVLTIQARKNAISRWTALFFVGVILLFLSSDNAELFISPGPVSMAHSNVTECSGCHSNISNSNFSWVPALLTASKPREDSLSCLKCHKLQETALFPHGAHPDRLNELSRKLSTYLNSTSPTILTSLGNEMFPAQNTFRNGVFCATCHKEHKGALRGLVDMSPTKCQTCHTLQFDSFEVSHSEFRDYPFKRRTRIKFDHVNHFNKHFPEERKKNDKNRIPPQVCTDCHTTGKNKKHMSVKPFDTVCSSCHLSQIRGFEKVSGPKGIAMLALPAIDIETLRKRGAAIGEWPSETEAELTPFMKMLLGWDRNRQKRISDLEEIDLDDLSSATDQQIRQVADLIWDIKLLIFELSEKSPAGVMIRTAAASNVNLKSDLTANLIASIPRDVITNARREWLPNLKTEVTRNLASRKTRPLEQPDAWKSNKVETAPAQQKLQQPSKTRSKQELIPEKKRVRKLPPPPEPAKPAVKPKEQPVIRKQTPEEEPVSPDQTDDLLREKLPGEAAIAKPPKAYAGLAAFSRDLFQLSGALFPSAEQILSVANTAYATPSQHKGGVKTGGLGKKRVRLAQNTGAGQESWRIDEFGNIIKNKPGSSSSAPEKPVTQKTQGKKEKVQQPPSVKTPEKAPPKPAKVEPSVLPWASEQKKPGVSQAQPVQSKGNDSSSPQASDKLPWLQKQDARRVPEEKKKESIQPALQPVKSDIAAEDWAETGGWYRQDYTIYYRPVGHKDRFIKSWLDFSGSIIAGTGSEPAKVVFNTLIDKETSGQCSKCHSVDILPNSGNRLLETRTVNWAPSSIENKKGAFTRFNHEPHFGLLGEEGCLSCHKINSTAKVAKNYKTPSPFVFQSNFKNINKATCSSCHNKGAARSDCLLCHKYHVNEVISPLLKTRLPDR